MHTRAKIITAICVLLMVTFGLVIIFKFFNLSDRYIAKCFWKFGGSEHPTMMRDVISFKHENLELKNGYFYLDGQAVAKIKEKKLRPFVGHYIAVSDIDGKNAGEYYDKGCK